MCDDRDVTRKRSNASIRSACRTAGSGNARSRGRA
jgi:hypothetical protein